MSHIPVNKNVLSVLLNKQFVYVSYIPVNKNVLSVLLNKQFVCLIYTCE